MRPEPHSQSRPEPDFQSRPEPRSESEESGPGGANGEIRLRDRSQPADLLASVSRSFYLSLKFLPVQIREPLGLGYLLARASDTIADASNASLKVRLEALDAFSNALSEADHEPLAPSFQNLSCTSPSEARLLNYADALLSCYHTLPTALREETLSVLTTITKGQRGDLIRFGYASEAVPQSMQFTSDTEAYTYAVAGCVGEFWTRICEIQLPRFAKRPVAELLDLGRNFGKGLQLVNILRDLPADLRAGRCYLPLEELHAENLTPADLLSQPQRARSLCERWLARAESLLNDGETYVRGIRGWRLRFSVALPRRLGLETLALLRHMPPLETSARVRVTRLTVLRCAIASIGEAVFR